MTNMKEIPAARAVTIIPNKKLLGEFPEIDPCTIYSYLDSFLDENGIEQIKIKELGYWYPSSIFEEFRMSLN